MPEQFVVPQFLDVESKIIGPITGRQFVIMLATLLVEVIIYRLFLSVVPMLALGIPVLVTGGIFAFAKVNEQPFHFIMLNMIQTFKKPMVRVWDKALTEKELKAHFKHEAPPPLPPRFVKARPHASRLSDLSLIVNTGGVYHPEDDE